jgi:hypothetical protein
LVYQSPDNTFANANVIATVQSWIPSTSTLSVTNIMGVFLDGGVAIGNTSGASYVVASYDPLVLPAIKEPYDNSLSVAAGSLFIDTTENNPIGGL